MYVHNADTAKSGVRRYNTKIKILKICIDFLILICLVIGIKTLEIKINEIS